MSGHESIPPRRLAGQTNVISRTELRHSAMIDAKTSASRFFVPLTNYHYIAFVKCDLQSSLGTLPIRSYTQVERIVLTEVFVLHV